MWGLWLLEVVLPEVLVLVLLLFLLARALIFSWTLLRSHEGYVHLSRTLCRCSSSFCKSWGLEQTALALWCRELTTLYLAGIVWWLSHCRYKAVLVDFLKTVVLRLPSGWGMTKMSRKSMESSILESSPVKCIHWSIKLICFRKLLLCADLMNTKVSSTYISTDLGLGDVLRALASNSSIYKFAPMGLIGEPIADPSSCS